jgi:Type II CAAX prenyl endopeptidase Rce1-like
MTVIQVVQAAFLGVAVAGARLYTGTIWPAVLFHILLDLLDVAGRGFALPTPQPLTPRVVVPLVLTGLCASYGWWLARRSPDLQVAHSTSNAFRAL